MGERQHSELSDRSHTEKVTLSVTAFVWSVQDEDTHRHRSQVDLSGADEEERWDTDSFVIYMGVVLDKFLIKVR